MKLVSKRQVGLLALAVVLVMGLLALLLLWAQSDERLPQPNGYSDLVRAGEAVVGKATSVDSKDTAQVAAFAVQNSAVLIHVRKGLGKECRVPVEFDAGWLSRHAKEFMALKQAGYALELLAEDREAAGAIDEAAAIRVDALRLGIESYRGGVLIDYAVGTKIELWALTNLRNMVERLNATQSRNILKIIQESGIRRMTFSDIQRREREWSWRGSGWWRSWDGVKERGGSIFQKSVFNFPASRSDQARSELVLSLARRAFELEQGRLPGSDVELVPDYLPKLPQRL